MSFDVTTMNWSKRTIWATFGAFVFALLAIGTFFTVDQNQMAVVSRLGKYDYTADAGLHWKYPFFNSVTYYRIDRLAYHNNEPVNTYSVDNQEVDVLFTVNYRIPADKVEFIFGNNRDYEARLQTLTVDRLKVEMGRVNVQQVAEKRGELRDAIQKILTVDAGKMGIEILDFQLSNLEYTKSFREAVNNAAVQKANVESVIYQKQQAQEAALMARVEAEGKANAVREAAKGEADAAVFRAEAQAKATKLNGEAQAYTIKVQGDSQASAIEAQAKALASNAQLVELEKARRWNGQLPTQLLSGITPFMPIQAPALGNK